jgi:hypothetical protein
LWALQYTYSNPGLDSGAAEIETVGLPLLRTGAGGRKTLRTLYLALGFHSKVMHVRDCDVDGTVNKAEKEPEKDRRCFRQELL